MERLERRIVAADETRDSIAALERARAEIETVLAGKADWLALRRDAARSSRLADELAFAANPLYRSWKRLNEAIEDLKARAQRDEPQPGAAPDDRTEQVALPEERRGAAEPAPAQRPVARAEARSIELSHILRHIRDSSAEAGDAASTARAAPIEAPAADATLTDDAYGRDAAGAADLESEARRVEAVDAGSDWGDTDVLAPEPEEASVTFVIRDAAPAASADGDATQGEADGGPLADQWAAVGADDGVYPETGGEVEEAEVVIVSRPAGRRSRKA